jgi:hypothetical protein
MACSGGGAPSTGSVGDAAVTADGQTTANPPPATDAGSTSDWSDVCSRAGAQASCDGATFDVAKCVRLGPCVDRDYRPELATAYAACISANGCGKSSEACEAEAAQPYVNEPAVQTYREACTARRGACTDAGAPFSGDNCEVGVAVVWASQLLQAWTACLSQDCTSLPSCFTAALGPSCQ